MVLYQTLMAVLSFSQGSYVIKRWCSPIFMLQMYSRRCGLFFFSPGSELILAYTWGDFNCWLDPYWTIALPIQTQLIGLPHSSSPFYLTSVFLMCGVSFIQITEYSFFSHVHHTFTRIDYFVIDIELIPLAHSCAYQGIVI